MQAHDHVLAKRELLEDLEAPGLFHDLVLARPEGRATATSILSRSRSAPRCLTSIRRLGGLKQGSARVEKKAEPERDTLPLRPGRASLRERLKVLRLQARVGNA